MSLLNLPDELLLDIAEFIEAEKDLNSFVRTCVRLNNVLSDYLYLNNARKHNSSALHWASSYGMIETARKSICQGGDFNTTFYESSYRRPQQAPVDAGRNDETFSDNSLAFMDGLIEQREITPLMQAMLRMNTGFIKILLAAGADPNARTPDQFTALLLLTGWRPNMTALKLLLDHGADPNLTCHGCAGPIEFAVSHNQEDMLKLLLE
ncbi:ankyrin repeat-containing domain protein [Aspergillus multicolor]|uniref:ankyrin repeat domain-containing protein n=1 Tax=Aspergillus multicolor TaxID=41759 RepID=UPI003CCD5ECB